MKKWVWILITCVVILLFGGVIGFEVRKSTYHCPVITPDTITVWDTVTHVIPDTVPHYIIKKITLIKHDTIWGTIDTTAILHDYLSTRIYEQVWRDSLLSVDISDTIRYNRLIGSDFRYRLLRPQTVVINRIDKSVTNYRYITGGIDVPIKNLNYIEIEANYVGPKGYVGIGWMPEIGGINIKGGMTFIRLKKIK